MLRLFISASPSFFLFTSFPSFFSAISWLPFAPHFSIYTPDAAFRHAFHLLTRRLNDIAISLCSHLIAIFAIIFCFRFIFMPLLLPLFYLLFYLSFIVLFSPLSFHFISSFSFPSYFSLFSLLFHSLIIDAISSYCLHFHYYFSSFHYSYFHCLFHYFAFMRHILFFLFHFISCHYSPFFIIREPFAWCRLIFDYFDICLHFLHCCYFHIIILIIFIIYMIFRHYYFMPICHFISPAAFSIFHLFPSCRLHIFAIFFHFHFRYFIFMPLIDFDYSLMPYFACHFAISPRACRRFAAAAISPAPFIAHHAITRYWYAQRCWCAFRHWRRRCHADRRNETRRCPYDTMLYISFDFIFTDSIAPAPLMPQRWCPLSIILMLPSFAITLRHAPCRHFFITPLSRFASIICSILLALYAISISIFRHFFIIIFRHFIAISMLDAMLMSISISLLAMPAWAPFHAIFIHCRAMRDFSRSFHRAFRAFRAPTMRSPCAQVQRGRNARQNDAWLADDVLRGVLLPLLFFIIISICTWKRCRMRRVPARKEARPEGKTQTKPRAQRSVKRR